MQGDFTMTGTLSKIALLTKAMTGTPSDVLLTKAMPGNTLLMGTPSDVLLTKAMPGNTLLTGTPSDTAARPHARAVAAGTGGEGAGQQN